MWGWIRPEASNHKMMTRTKESKWHQLRCWTGLNLAGNQFAFLSAHLADLGRTGFGYRFWMVDLIGFIFEREQNGLWTAERCEVVMTTFHTAEWRAWFGAMRTDFKVFWWGALGSEVWSGVSSEAFCVSVSVDFQNWWNQPWINVNTVLP